MDALAVEGVTDIFLPTGGAAFAETTFSARDVPVRTAFRNEAGEEMSYITYIGDERDRVVEVYGPRGTMSPPPSSREAAIQQAIAEQFPNAEPFRATFRYDESGRVVELTTYFYGEIDCRMAHTYNENGDIATTETNEDEEVIRFEYEYDHWRNWVRQVTHRTSGVFESHRHITYYE